jgi:hypothetical protein
MRAFVIQDGDTDWAVLTGAHMPPLSCTSPSPVLHCSTELVSLHEDYEETCSLYSV